MYNNTNGILLTNTCTHNIFYNNAVGYNRTAGFASAGTASNNNTIFQNLAQGNNSAGATLASNFDSNAVPVNTQTVAQYSLSAGTYSVAPSSDFVSISLEV